jgi:hypothetical protein
MQLNRNFNAFLERFYQIIGCIGGNQTRHILDADGIRTGIFELFCKVDKILDIMNRA